MEHRKWSLFRNLQNGLNLRFPAIIKQELEMNGGMHADLTYSNCVLRIFVWYFEQFHGFDHALHGHEDILIDKLDETPFVFIGISRPMDDSHLLDKRTLP